MRNVNSIMFLVQSWIIKISSFLMVLVFDSALVGYFKIIYTIESYQIQFQTDSVKLRTQYGSGMTLLKASREIGISLLL